MYSFYKNLQGYTVSLEHFSIYTASLKIYLKYNFKSDTVPVKLSYVTQFQGLLQSYSNGDSMGAKYRHSSAEEPEGPERPTQIRSLSFCKWPKAITWRKSGLFNKPLWDNWISVWEKKRPRHADTYLYVSKNKVKMDPRPTCKCKIIKLLEESLKAWSKKDKNAKFNFIKTKNLSAKDAASRMKRQAILKDYLQNTY